MTGLEAREVIEDAVRRELFGPRAGGPPAGVPVDCSTGMVHFESLEASRGQFHEATTLQEILTRSDPLRRYGIGVLYNGASQRGAATPPETSDGDHDDLDLSLDPPTGCGPVR